MSAAYLQNILSMKNPGAAMLADDPTYRNFNKWYSDRKSTIDQTIARHRLLTHFASHLESVDSSGSDEVNHWILAYVRARPDDLRQGIKLDASYGAFLGPFCTAMGLSLAEPPWIGYREAEWSGAYNHDEEAILVNPNEKCAEYPHIFAEETSHRLRHLFIDKRGFSGKAEVGRWLPYASRPSRMIEEFFGRLGAVIYTQNQLDPHQLKAAIAGNREFFTSLSNVMRQLNLSASGGSPDMEYHRTFQNTVGYQINEPIGIPLEGGKRTSITGHDVGYPLAYEYLQSNDSPNGSYDLESLFSTPTGDLLTSFSRDGSASGSLLTSYLGFCRLWDRYIDIIWRNDLMTTEWKNQIIFMRRLEKEEQREQKGPGGLRLV